MGIDHETAQENPDRYKILSNGAVYDLELKKIVGNPGGGSTAITQASASAYNKLAREKYKEAAAEAIQNAIDKRLGGVATPFDAWGILNARMAEQILDSAIPRGFDLRILGEHMGAIARDQEIMQENSSPAGVPERLIEALTGLLAVVMNKKDENPHDQDVINGDFS